jgi:predicted ribosome quality control (RQC) complex YloA/Tae2 family protein
MCSITLPLDFIYFLICPIHFWPPVLFFTAEPLQKGLIISARDGQQTELLIRKYFRKGDIYIHSDIQGSSVVIIKNTAETGVIPPGTLSQAGIMAIATSRAWEVKQGTLPLPPVT